MEHPSATEPDWTREELHFLQWSPSRRLLRAVRGYQRWKNAGAWARPLRAWAAVRVRFWNIICSSDIPPEATLGGGFCLPHPNGIVIHPAVKVGVNCMLFQQVTLGIGGSKPGAPIIGGHVDIGAGAKILGGVIVGDHARIGANAVVLCDVPEGATAVGMPARIILAKSAPRAAPVEIAPIRRIDALHDPIPQNSFCEPRTLTCDPAPTCNAEILPPRASPVSAD